LKKANPINISVIIPTYNRKTELEKLLYSLNRQTLPSSQFEIIVVDDGSTDGTEEWLLKNMDHFNVKISFYHQTRGGPGAARNLGMEKAAGDIFAFTDTDCIAETEWLERLLKHFNSEKVGAVGGSEIINDKDPLLMRCFHYLMTSPFTTGGLRGKKGKKLARFYPRTFNMAMSKKAYQATKGFKKMFHAEDIELSYRIKEKGFDLMYEDSARVYHRRRTHLTHFLKQIFYMGRARITLARIHPSSLELLHVLPALAVFFLFLSIISSLFWHPALLMLTLCLGIGLFFLIIVGIDSALKLRSLKSFFLVPLSFILQQAAYGIGFITALISHDKQKSD
jgi:GT2 family glycosyltransferase